ncbi:hypothetical protein [Paenibacillus puerhi]|uniref:hypothetical protein n=1 Tax=Paenibacillus puerhi TaxID=2692622 RepID=UPI00135ABB30|nr:hypothetical protein [Paenibacillus puerhi]
MLGGRVGPGSRAVAGGNGLAAWAEYAVRWARVRAGGAMGAAWTSGTRIGPQRPYSPPEPLFEQVTDPDAVIGAEGANHGDDSAK